MRLAKAFSRFNPFSSNEAVEERAMSLKEGAVSNTDANSFESLWIDALLGATQSSAGVNVTHLAAMGVTTVFACIDVLARSVATLPLNIYRGLPENGGMEPAVDHPLYDLLHDDPNPEMTTVDLRRAMQANMSLHGNGYALILRNGFDEIVEIQPVPAWDVTVKRVGRSIRYVIDGWEYDSFQVIHLRGNTFNGFLGHDIISTARDAIGLAIALDRNAGYFFKNGSFPGGFLKYPGKLKPEAVANILASFQQETGGANSGKLKLLQQGLDYQPGREKNADSQFDESRDRQAKDICRLFGVPGRKVGIADNQPRANAEQENLSFMVDTLRPILETWQKAFNKKLLTREERKEYHIGFNISAMLQGDFKSQNEAFALGRQWGWFSVNDVRKMLNLNPIGEQGDIYLQPMNMTDSSTQPTQNNE